MLDVVPDSVVVTLSNQAGNGSPLAIEHKIYIGIVGVACPPYKYKSRLRPLNKGAFEHLVLRVMDSYDVALTDLERDSDKDFQDVLALAERAPFDLELFENATSMNSGTKRSVRR